MAELTYGKTAPGSIGKATNIKQWIINVENFICNRNLLIRLIIVAFTLNFVAGLIIPFLIFDNVKMVALLTTGIATIIIAYQPAVVFKPLYLLAEGNYKAVEKIHYTQSKYVRPLVFALYLGYSSGILAIHKDHKQGLAPHQYVELKLADAATNIVIIGGIGSGKTTRLMQPLLDQALAQDCGMFIFDIKNDFKKAVFQLAEKNGREVEVIGIGGKQLNLIEGLTPEMSASFLKSAFYLNGGSGSGDSFWIDTATALCQNALGVLSYTDDYTLADLYRYLFYENDQKAYTLKANQIMVDLKTRDSAILLNYMNYQAKVFNSFDEKVRRGVLASVAQVLSPFLHPDMIEAFCTSPVDRAELEKIVDGRIYLVDLPLATWGLAGKAVYTFLKLRFFNILQSRAGNPNMNQDRPVVFMCDEYQEIISASKTGISDLSFWDKSRSAKCIGIISAQSINSFRSAIGDKTLADTVLQNFRQKFFFRTEDIDTIKYMNELAGKAEVQRKSQSEGSSNSGFSGSSNQGESTSWTERDIINAPLVRELNQDQVLALLNINGQAADDILLVKPLYVN